MRICRARGVADGQKENARMESEVFERIREYLADKAEYAHLLPLMDAYMAQYCVF